MGDSLGDSLSRVYEIAINYRFWQVIPAEARSRSKYLDLG